MSLETARSFFLWCSIMNIVLLLVWAALATLGRGWLYRLVSRLFRVSPEYLDMLNLAGITAYKTGVLLFNIVPCIALHLVK